MTIALSPQHNTSQSYASDVNRSTFNRAKELDRDINSGGETDRATHSKDPEAFERAQILLNRNGKYITQNTTTGVLIKNMASEIDVFQRMASDFKSKLTEVRNSSSYVDPAFQDNIQSDLKLIGQKLNHSIHGFRPFGFDTGGVAVVDETLLSTALPAGSGADFTYLNAKIDGKLTFRASDNRTIELSGSVFHSVMEKFTRAQRMALSANMNGNRVDDAALSSAAALMDSAIEDFQKLQTLFGRAAGMFDDENESLKSEAVNLGTAIKETGYVDRREAIQRQADMGIHLQAQDANLMLSIQRSQRLIDDLKRV